MGRKDGRAPHRARVRDAPKLDQRLHLLLWEIAERYGRVHPDGVHVELPLTHEVIAHLAGAQRPSLSTSMARLADQGLIHRTESGWLLRGEAPAAPSVDEAAAPFAGFW
jgi:CRP/FNR family cyclic AMP-dependent transcriptional regulator